MADQTRDADPLASADRDTLIALINTLRGALHDCIQEKEDLEQHLIEWQERF